MRFVIRKVLLVSIIGGVCSAPHSPPSAFAAENPTKKVSAKTPKRFQEQRGPTKPRGGDGRAQLNSKNTLPTTGKGREEDPSPSGQLTRPTQDTEQPTQSGSKTESESPFSTMLGLKGSGAPEGDLEIRSRSVSLDAKERVFTYRGNVEVTRGDLRITAETMTGRYDEGNRLQTIVCERDVVITRGDGTNGPVLRATSNRAVYNVPKAIIELTEGPELIRSGNALSADKVLIYVNEDRSEAEGNVQVKVVKTEDVTKGKTKGVR